MKKIEWKRNCPECGKEIPYSTISNKNKAEKENRNCRSCSKKEKNCSVETRKMMSESKKGENNPAKRSEIRKKISESLKGRKREPFTEETRKRMRENHADFSGKNHPNYGKSIYYFWTQKYGEEKADKREAERRKKQRLTLLKNIKNRCGQISPNYNPVACEIIRWFNMYYEFNFQHAENGGEVCIGGYFPDGVDEKRKTIIEIDELRHFNSDGKLKEKDIRRQKYLEGLGYKFIRVRI